MKPFEFTHAGEVRPKVANLDLAYGHDEVSAPAASKRFVIFDDVLTNSRHFSAMVQVLQAAFSGVAVAGVFVARRMDRIVRRPFDLSRASPVGLPVAAGRLGAQSPTRLSQWTDRVQRAPEPSNG